MCTYVCFFHSVCTCIAIKYYGLVRKLLVCFNGSLEGEGGSWGRGEGEVVWGRMGNGGGSGAEEKGEVEEGGRSVGRVES